jgi:hypothetical protein
MAKEVRSFCPSFGSSRTVTEAEWLASDDPLLLLAILEPWAADEVVSDRQLRLFACACSRRLWHVLPEQRRKDVELAERFVDGRASVEEISARRREISRAKKGRARPDEPAIARWCVLDGSGYGGPDDYRWELLTALRATRGAGAEAAQAALLRDIVGNPFRRVEFAPDWRTSTTVALAGGIYEEHAFERMPVLADALMDAGCEGEHVLSHCRGPGPHVRGCWVIDLLLGKR